MAATMVDHTPAYARLALDSMAPEDFETASIRSAAPSYTSDAPSYHSTAPHPDPLPPYSPPARATSLPSSGPGPGSSVSSLLGPDPSSASRRQGPGLPPVPSGPPRQPEPSLSQFRIPSWPTSTSNPTARIYHNVALRRASAASGSGSSSSSAARANAEGLRRAMLERIEEEEERNRVRPLEDPYLVGEEAAARATRERLARETRGDEILLREDRRWDFFLGGFFSSSSSSSFLFRLPSR
ncbi:hypothetical protein BT67DRAFT_201300 [Trichocladium antarcticum]|uniref:Uncharacterized protein n=1 Tax=Trichocladium antarcticum TaxID=1450529 RepID=A0AAN6UQX2_9PEZI|nr:hypothetical protein BT67DRAFT_201300 [Trichocladium antarcticum]